MTTFISMLDNRDVTDYISSGRTLIFAEKSEADASAQRRKSYVYPVREIVSGRNKEIEIDLYASPK